MALDERNRSMATKARAAEAEEPVAEETAVKEPKPKAPPREDGPFDTRNGSKALAVKGRVFTAGGAKGDAIADLLRKGEMSRKEIAAVVGCSPSRVAEVAKVLGMGTTRATVAKTSENGEATTE